MQYKYQIYITSVFGSRVGRQLGRIRELQNAIVEMNVIPKSLPLLARSSDDTARETLAFLARLLFNANAFVQVGLI